jgi:ABC-type iron transport system FetAB ATPase subunit
MLKAFVNRHTDCDTILGSIVAIAGGSGSGKSTLANLLVRYYDPNSGRVLYGEENIRDYTPESWRNRIALVPQEPALFSTTIAENSKPISQSFTSRLDQFIPGTDLAHVGTQFLMVNLTPLERKLKKWLGWPTVDLSTLFQGSSFSLIIYENHL